MASFSRFIKRICFIGRFDCNQGGGNPINPTIGVMNNGIQVVHNGVIVIHTGA